MSATTATGIRDAIRSAFRGKPVKRVELFGSAARGEVTSDSDVDILVTPSPEATRHELFIMAAESRRCSWGDRWIFSFVLTLKP